GAANSGSNHASGSTGRVPAKELKKLIARIKDADYQALAATPFTGRCPVEKEDGEVTYTFYMGKTDHSLDSCEVEIEKSAPVFGRPGGALPARAVRDPPPKVEATA